MRLHLKGKVATPFVEAGNMVFSVPEAHGTFAVQKCGIEIDVQKDIVRNANRILWATDEYARIGNVRLSSVDAPARILRKERRLGVERRQCAQVCAGVCRKSLQQPLGDKFSAVDRGGLRL